MGSSKPPRLTLGRFSTCSSLPGVPPGPQTKGNEAERAPPGQPSVPICLECSGGGGAPYGSPIKEPLAKSGTDFQTWVPRTLAFASVDGDGNPSSPCVELRPMSVHALVSVRHAGLSYGACAQWEGQRCERRVTLCYEAPGDTGGAGTPDGPRRGHGKARAGIR